jgi:hypothetical protein
MSRTTQLAREDKALIEREIGNGLRSYYGPVAREPLPAEFEALLKQLEETEARCGDANEDGPSGLCG